MTVTSQLQINLTLFESKKSNALNYMLKNSKLCDLTRMSEVNEEQKRSSSDLPLQS